MPPVVYLLCGLTGSGKTTYARQLEAAGTDCGGAATATPTSG
jgi:adenylylsulfate kinase-like enzyme